MIVCTIFEPTTHKILLHAIWCYSGSSEWHTTWNMRSDTREGATTDWPRVNGLLQETGWLHWEEVLRATREGVGGACMNGEVRIGRLEEERRRGGSAFNSSKYISRYSLHYVLTLWTCSARKIFTSLWNSPAKSHHIMEQKLCSALSRGIRGGNESSGVQARNTSSHHFKSRIHSWLNGNWPVRLLQWLASHTQLTLHACRPPGHPCTTCQQQGYGDLASKTNATDIHASISMFSRAFALFPPGQSSYKSSVHLKHVCIWPWQHLIVTYCITNYLYLQKVTSIPPSVGLELSAAGLAKNWQSFSSRVTHPGGGGGWLESRVAINTHSLDSS